MVHGGMNAGQALDLTAAPDGAAVPLHTRGLGTKAPGKPGAAPQSMRSGRRLWTYGPKVKANVQRIMQPYRSATVSALPSSRTFRAAVPAGLHDQVHLTGVEGYRALALPQVDVLPTSSPVALRSTTPGSRPRLRCTARL